MAWLSVTPKKPDGKPGDMSRAQMMQRDGGTLGMPDVTAHHLAHHLHQLGMCSHTGMGLTRLTAVELAAYQQITSTPFSPWEATALLAASGAYVGEFYANNDAPPFGNARDLADPAVISDRLRAALAPLAVSKPKKRH